MRSLRWRAGWRHLRTAGPLCLLVLATAIACNNGDGKDPDRSYQRWLERLATIPSTAELLAGPNIKVVNGLPPDTRFRPPLRQMAPHTVYDARQMSMVQHDEDYSVILGSESADTPPEQAWIGGRLDGTNDREWTRRTWKATHDGTSLMIRAPGWSVVDGLRARNVQDGFRPQPGANGTDSLFRISNSWLEYIRDDAVENDHLLGGLIEDCLIDGTFVFLSQQSDAPFTWNGYDRVTIRDTLVRLGELPEVRPGQPGPKDPSPGSIDQHGNGTGMLFKDGARIPLDVRDSIFVVPRRAVGAVRSMALPGSPSRYSNVTLVWLGEGPYPAPVPRGVRVTRDISVWNAAVAEWKARHGVADWENVDMNRFINPLPPRP